MSIFSFSSSSPFPSTLRLFMAFSLVMALAFWIAQLMQLYPGRGLIKWLAITSLAAMVWHQRQSGQEILLAAALFCHSVGDVLLALDRKEWFLLAVAAFFCGHVLYIVTFWPDVFPVRPLTPLNIALLLVVMIFAFAMGKILIPRLPDTLLLPIVIYMIAIAAMALAAILANYSTNWVVMGAMFYLFSDALIGITMFVRPLALSDYLVWPAYYLGQFLIAAGFLQRHNS